MTTFEDLFRFSLFDNSTAISLPDGLLALGLSLLLGLFIYLVYRKTYSGVMLSRSFGGSLIAMTMITTMAILTVTSSALLSLGMVGALSIVRFRSAIKEPMDIAFLFWAITGGIVIAAGMIPMAVIGSLVIGLVLILFCNRKSGEMPYMLMVTCTDAQGERTAEEYITRHVKKAVVKSKSAQAGMIETTYEVLLRDNNTRFLTGLTQMDQIQNAALVSYNGDTAK